MKVWIVLVTKDYSEILLGVFSTKQKAIDRVTDFCGQKPDFENDIYWSPEFDEDDDNSSNVKIELLKTKLDKIEPRVL